MNQRILFNVILWIQVVLVGLCPVYAQSAVQKEIENAYKKAARALELKFLDGLFSLRDWNFEAYNQRGQGVDLVAERQRFIDLFKAAQSATERDTVSAFRQIDAGNAECEVHQLIEVKSASGVLKLDSRVRDRWVLTKRGWRIRSSRILKQTLKQG